MPGFHHFFLSCKIEKWLGMLGRRMRRVELQDAWRSWTVGA